LDYAISELNQTPIWDDRFAKESMYDFENDLLKSDFSFVYIATDMPYWSDLKKAQEMRKNLNEKYAHCAAYTGETATIWNLACMRNKSLNPI
jgi:hypothetical protein